MTSRLRVHVAIDAETHLFEGDHAMNMRDREQKGRAGRQMVGMRGLSRRQLAIRSRTLRYVAQTMRWNREAIAAMFSGPDQHASRLLRRYRVDEWRVVRSGAQPQ
ncbi:MULTISPECIES: hypothetical protein [unclassified Microbacterium]|uniref:hypothetical protein n=1 Tax=unclassified Microbacterium TaxID=2609290 RepID=UPI0015E4901C|nr:MULTISPECIES: hypothetical protein [unclassified Microbacterium]